MFSDNLSTLTAESDDIRAYIDKQNNLILSRPYKGILVDHEQVVLDFQPNFVVVQVSRAEKFWDFSGHTVFIRNPKSLKAFATHLIEFNPSKGVAYLSNFKLLNHDWSERYAERVQPKSPVYVTLLLKKRKLLARVVDISPDGMGVWTSEALRGSFQSKGSLSLRCILHTPFFNEKMNVPGSIIYMQQCQKSTVKAGIRLDLSATRTRQLGQYIASRKKEILEELSQTIFDFQQPRESSSLFF